MFTILLFIVGASGDSSNDAFFPPSQATSAGSSQVNLVIENPHQLPRVSHRGCYSIPETKMSSSDPNNPSHQIEGKISNLYVLRKE